MQRLLCSNNNWNQMCLGMFLLHYIASPETHDLMSNFVCPCLCLTWFFLCVCVSAGVRGSPQSGAEGLRSRLDHCHQSAGGNPHLFAVSCATLEGKHTNARLWSYKTVLCWSFHSKQEGVVTSLCVWLWLDDGTVSSCRETAGGRGGGGGVSSLWALNNHEKDKSQTGQ